MATFRLVGESGGSAAAVTEHLGLDPTEAFEAGVPVSARSTGTREQSMWTLRSSDGPIREELGVQLRVLLDALEPVVGKLWDLVKEGYWANWFCFVGSSATEHAVELDRHTLQRLLAFPGELCLDVCPDEETARSHEG